MLYRVKVTREFVVAATDVNEAERMALVHEKEEDPVIARLVQMDTESNLPPGWTPNCVPYGPDQETTIAGHLKKNL